MNHYKIWRLRNQHRELERRIRVEQNRLEPDALLLQDLKRRRLQVRDEIFLAEAGLEPVLIHDSRSRA